MSKVVMQVNTPERVQQLCIGPVYFMTMLVREDFMTQQSGGVMLHLIGQGISSIDFVCYSVLITSWPSGTGTKQAVNTITSYFAKKLNIDDPKEAWFYGLELPKGKDGDVMKASELTTDQEAVSV